MRNWTWGLIIILLFGFWFFYVMIWKPDEIVKKETQFGDLYLMGMVGLGFGLYGTMLMYKYTDHASGFGDHTELMDTVPIDHVMLSDPKDVSKTYEFDLFARHGCKFLAMRGGGTSGYIIARKDLLLSMDGDPCNLLIYGVPELYKMDAAPGSEYRDLACLPKELFDMVIQANGFHPKGIVAVYMDPVTNDPRKRIDTLEMLPYKDLYDIVNKENKSLYDQNDKLLKANSKYSQANLKNARAYAGDKQGLRERMRERREQEGEEDEETR